MNKKTKTTPTPFFITELAEVRGGKRLPRTTINEDGRGTTRMTGEEGDRGGGFVE